MEFHKICVYDPHLVFEKKTAAFEKFLAKGTTAIEKDIAEMASNEKDLFYISTTINKIKAYLVGTAHFGAT